MGLIRTLITVVILGTLVYCGATVKLGNRTFFGHVSRIWQSDEAQDLVHGVKETSAPMVEKLQRGIKAGIDEARKNESPDAGAARAPD